MREKMTKENCEAFRLRLPLFHAFARNFFVLPAASADGIFYCSHVRKLFYDDANPINAHTFQGRSMFICQRQKYGEYLCRMATGEGEER